MVGKPAWRGRGPGRNARRAGMVAGACDRRGARPVDRDPDGHTDTGSDGARNVPAYRSRVLQSDGGRGSACGVGVLHLAEVYRRGASILGVARVCSRPDSAANPAGRPRARYVGARPTVWTSLIG